MSSTTFRPARWASWATTLQTNGMNGSVNFYQNPNALGTDLLTNYSSSSYNSLQLEARHQMRSGLSFEANYTFSKVLSDADGDVQSRLQHFLDINNPGIERSRANFDLTHMIKADGFYELPFGKGHPALPPAGPRDRRLDLRQHHGMAIRRAVLDPLGAGNAQPRIALLLQRRRYHPRRRAARQCGQIPDDRKRPHDDFPIRHQSRRRNGREHGWRAGFPGPGLFQSGRRNARRLAAPHVQRPLDLRYRHARSRRPSTSPKPRRSSCSWTPSTP